VATKIVVLETFFTHLTGKDAKQAAFEGRAEIGMAAIAITLVEWRRGPIISSPALPGRPAGVRVVMVAATLLRCGQLHADAADRLEWKGRGATSQGKPGCGRFERIFEPGYLWLRAHYKSRCCTGHCGTVR